MKVDVEAADGERPELQARIVPGGDQRCVLREDGWRPGMRQDEHRAEQKEPAERMGGRTLRWVDSPLGRRLPVMQLRLT